jgi:uncharacterized protein (DUF58 family)
MLLVYLYLEFRGHQPYMKVPYNVLIALSLPLFFEPLVGAWISPVFALPVIPLLDYSLRQFALGYDFGSAKEGRWPTGLCISLTLFLLIVVLVTLVLGSWGLLLSAVIVIGYLASLIGLVLRRISKTPAEAEVVKQRVVAGDLIQTPVRLVNRSALAGQLCLLSTRSWFQVRPARLVLNKPALEIEASLTATLAGPTQVVLDASFIDPWGLIRTDFRLTVLELLVIPRAKYAEWMARRYLEISRGGGQEAMTSVASSSRRASRRGVEFYGLRAYQPGDSARMIDWKHTSKLHQMIVKEFLDTGVESAVLAVNLSVTDEEEKDKVIFNLITTALTLARENIPSALTAYNSQEVVRTTQIIDPRQALVESLSLAREVKISLSPRRYLAVTDVSRLRANLYRLRQSQHAPANRLAELLQLEYAALNEAAQQNPASEALANVLAKVKGKVNFLIVSAHNHDAEALAFSQHTLKERGYHLLMVDLGASMMQKPLTKAWQ